MKRLTVIAPVVPRQSKGLRMSRKAYTPQRHTDAAFSPSERDSFMAGEWTKCKSSHWEWVKYLKDAEELHVQFRGGAKGYYSGVSEPEALEFADAPSKGGHGWDKIRDSKTWTYS